MVIRKRLARKSGRKEYLRLKRKNLYDAWNRVPHERKLSEFKRMFGYTPSGNSVEQNYKMRDKIGKINENKLEELISESYDFKMTEIHNVDKDTRRMFGF